MEGEARGGRRGRVKRKREKNEGQGERIRLDDCRKRQETQRSEGKMRVIERERETGKERMCMGN